MRPRLLASLCSACLLVQACASVDVRTDRDPQASLARYRTYDWLPAADAAKFEAARRLTGEPIAQANLVDDPILDKRIRSVVESDLKARGFSPAQDSPPDFYVTSYLIARDRVRVDSWGWGGTWGGYWGPSPYMFGLSSGYSRFPVFDTYNEDTLVVAFVDRETKEPFWRGVATGEIDPKAEDGGNLVSSVSEMFEQLPSG